MNESQNCSDLMVCSGFSTSMITSTTPRCGIDGKSIHLYVERFHFWVWLRVAAHQLLVLYNSHLLQREYLYCRRSCSSCCWHKAANLKLGFLSSRLLRLPSVPFWLEEATFWIGIDVRSRSKQERRRWKQGWEGTRREVVRREPKFGLSRRRSTNRSSKGRRFR